MADMDDVAALARLFDQKGNRAYRRYTLKQVDGRLMLVRDQLDLFFELALSDVLGTDMEPDDKDGSFLS
jgi:hypothetical protein